MRPIKSLLDSSSTGSWLIVPDRVGVGGVVAAEVFLVVLLCGESAAASIAAETTAAAKGEGALSSFARSGLNRVSGLDLLGENPTDLPREEPSVLVTAGAVEAAAVVEDGGGGGGGGGGSGEALDICTACGGPGERGGPGGGGGRGVAPPALAG